MSKPNFDEEKILWQQGFEYVVGLDEVGRGPLAGPVVAGAVLIKANVEILIDGINDSKKVSEKNRNKLYELITNNKDIEWGIGIVSEKVIDKINILEATKLAMCEAVAQIEKKINNKVDYLLIDGNFTLRQAQGEQYILQKAIVKGDQKVMSIAAASIIAKVTRDRIMEEMHKKYPHYGFDKHKGYGTEAHMKVLRKIGNCPIHRESFNWEKKMKKVIHCLPLVLKNNNR